MRLTLVPPAHPILSGLVAVAGRERALVHIRLAGVAGEKGPLAAVGAGLDPDAVVAVFLEVDPHPGPAVPRLTVTVSSGTGCSVVPGVAMMPRP